MTSDTDASNTAEPESQHHGDVYWPADLAPVTVPDSRILTYGYDTKIRLFAAGRVSRKPVYGHVRDFYPPSKLVGAIRTQGIGLSSSSRIVSEELLSRRL
jgi:hypothetical protein